MSSQSTPPDTTGAPKNTGTRYLSLCKRPQSNRVVVSLKEAMTTRVLDDRKERAPYLVMIR